MAKNSKKAHTLSFNPVTLRKAVMAESGARDGMWTELAKLAVTDDDAARACIIEARMLHGLSLDDTDANLAKVRAILTQSGRKLDGNGQPILNDSEGKPRRSEECERAYTNARGYVRDWFKRIDLKRNPLKKTGTTGAGKSKTKPAPEKAATKGAPIPAVATVQDSTAFMLQALNQLASLSAWAHKPENAKHAPPKFLGGLKAYIKSLTPKGE
jgi:hypothetical protein